MFIGDNAEYLANFAQKHDPSAWLLTAQSLPRYHTETAQRSVTVYTSLSDLPKDLSMIYQLWSGADKIYYHPPMAWSDNKKFDVCDPTDSIQGLTETLLLWLPPTVDIQGPDLFSQTYDPMLLADLRKIDSAQMWIAGCSFSHGVGVELHQRYGQLLADDLNLPCSFLTRPGSAVDWAADQILRSDIRPGDLVIWGLTESRRITYVHDNQLLKGITVTCFDTNRDLPDEIEPAMLLSQQNYYRQRYAIQQVINYCNKIGARLFLLGLLPGNYNLLGFLRAQKQHYIHIPYTLRHENSALAIEFLDLGNDQRHPGPRQHQQYKDIILPWLVS